jgi:hypothetical protein
MGIHGITSRHTPSWAGSMASRWRAWRIHGKSIWFLTPPALMGDPCFPILSLTSRPQSQPRLLPVHYHHTFFATPGRISQALAVRAEHDVAFWNATERRPLVTIQDDEGFVVVGCQVGAWRR